MSFILSIYSFSVILHDKDPMNLIFCALWNVAWIVPALMEIRKVLIEPNLAECSNESIPNHHPRKK